MKSRSRIVWIIALSGLSLGGCVDQKKYDDLLETNQTSAARIEQLTQENQTYQGGLDRKQARILELEAEMRQLKGVNSDLTGQIGTVKEGQRGIRDALNNIRLAALNPETDKALQALAEQYKDIIRYDAARGMLQFMSDLTFDSGSDAVKPNAKASLEKLAQIMKNSSAGEYDLRIVGHTDNQPISNPSTSKRFASNRVLSAYRAIAVEEALRSGGLSPNRMEIAGWGEYRPVVPNRGRGGTVENRRVEVYVVPSTATSGAVEGGASGAREPVKKPAQPEMPLK